MKVISPAPHLHSGNSTTRIMRDVVIAMLPALAFAVYQFGLSSLYVTAVAVLSCMACEWIINKFMLKRANTLCDYSAIVTGILLAFNLPSDIPLWIVVVGAVVAIGVAKMSYGGLGRNLFNPALVGRVFLLISFPVQMTSFSVDGVSGATPLGLLKEKGAQAVPEVIDMLLGVHGGSLGEVSSLLLLLGGLYLLFRKVITWHIPVAVLGSMAVFGELAYLINPEASADVLFHLFAGGAMLGAFYMATDYVSSPMSPRGQIIYGVGIGVITMLIRLWGAYPEGISFAILIMNAVVPLINNTFKPRRFAK